MSVEADASVERPKENVLVTLGGFDLPSLGNSLKEVYRAGSLPLALVFVGSAGFLWLVLREVNEGLAIATYLIGTLFLSAVLLFVFISLLGYRQWNIALRASLKNRRMEMELYRQLATANAEMQDKFVLTLLEHISHLSQNAGSTPEGRRAEIVSVTDSVGNLITTFLRTRNELHLPEFTPLSGGAPSALPSPKTTSMERPGPAG